MSNIPLERLGPTSARLGIKERTLGGGKSFEVVVGVRNSIECWNIVQQNEVIGVMMAFYLLCSCLDGIIQLS